MESGDCYLKEEIAIQFIPSALKLVIIIMIEDIQNIWSPMLEEMTITEDCVEIVKNNS